MSDFPCPTCGDEIRLVLYPPIGEVGGSWVAARLGIAPDDVEKHADCEALA